MPNTAPFNVSTPDVLLAFAEVYINQRADSFAGLRLAPVVSQDSEAKIIRSLNRGDLARPEMALRASGAAAAQAGFGAASRTVTVRQWALAKPTGEREIAGQDSVLDLEQANTAYLMEQYLLRREIEIAATVWGAGIWDTDFTPATLWNVATATPVTDVATAIQTIKRGAMVNPPQSWFSLFLGADAWMHLKERLELRILPAPYGELVDLQAAARVLGIGACVLADAVQNTGPHGGADNGADIFDPDDALLLCTQPVPENLGRMPARIGAAFTHVWPREGFDAQGLRMKSFFKDVEDSLVVQADAEFIPAIGNTALGYFFNEVVA